MKVARRKPSDPKRLADILGPLLERQETEQVEPRRRVVAAWRRVAEKLGLRGTRVAGFRDGIVQIEIESPPLCAELSQFRRSEVERAMDAELGEDNPLKSLRFRLGAFE